MESDFVVRTMYRFVARLDDDPLIERRVREHAHLLRQELKAVYPNADLWLPTPPAA